MLPWGRRDKYYDPPKRRVPGIPPGDAFGTPEAIPQKEGKPGNIPAFPRVKVSLPISSTLDWIGIICPDLSAA